MTAGAVCMDWKDVQLRPIIVLEGVSERAYLRALDRRIGLLSGQSRILVSAAHDLTHRALTLDVHDSAYNDSGMSSVFQALDLLAWCTHSAANDWMTTTAWNHKGPFLGTTRAHTDKTHSSLLSRTWGDANGMPSQTWLTAGEKGVVTPAEANLRITYSGDSAQVLAAVRAVLLRLVSALLATAYRWRTEIRLLRRKRSHVRARLGHCEPVRMLDIRAFVLAIVAVWRRYGHRSEPDDHASLINHRHLVFVGSCPPM